VAEGRNASKNSKERITRSLICQAQTCGSVIHNQVCIIEFSLP